MAGRRLLRIFPPPLISSMAGPDDGPAVVRRDLAKEVLGGGEEENGGEVSLVPGVELARWPLESNPRRHFMLMAAGMNPGSNTWQSIGEHFRVAAVPPSHNHFRDEHRYVYQAKHLEGLARHLSLIRPRPDNNS